MRKSRTSQAADKLHIDVDVPKGTTSQAAEKLHLDVDVRKGTTSVVPIAALMNVGL